MNPFEVALRTNPDDILNLYLKNPAQTQQNFNDFIDDIIKKHLDKLCTECPQGQKVQCLCGGEFFPKDRKKHERTKKHKSECEA